MPNIDFNKIRQNLGLIPNISATKTSSTSNLKSNSKINFDEIRKNLGIIDREGKPITPVIPDKPLVKVSKLSESVGGGSYNTVIGKPYELLVDPQVQYGLLNSTKNPGEEGHHIIGYETGGKSTTDNFINLTKREHQRITDIQNKSLRDYKSGKISLGEARLNSQTELQNILMEREGMSQNPLSLTNISKGLDSIISGPESLGAKISNFVASLANEQDKKVYDKIIKPVKDFIIPSQEELAKRYEAAKPATYKGREISLFGNKERKDNQGLIFKSPEGRYSVLNSMDIAMSTGPLTKLPKTVIQEISEKVAATKETPAIVEHIKPLFKNATEEELNTIARPLVNITEPKEIKSILQKAIPAIDEVVPRVTSSPKDEAWLKERGFVSSVKEELPNIKATGEYKPRSTETLAIKASNLVKNDLPAAERYAANHVDDNAVAIGAELLKDYSSKIEETADQAIKDSLSEKAATLANTMARNLTEQGRSIQAASILSRLTPEGQVKFAAREIQKFNESVDKRAGGIFGLQKKIPELTKEQSRVIIDEMNAIKDMPDGLDKNMRFQKLQNYITKLVPTPLFKKVVAVWKAGLLTGIKTSGLNILANASHLSSETIKDAPATMVDKIVSVLTGKRTVTFSTKGVPSGTKEGFDKAIRYFTTGYDERNIGTKLDYSRVNFGKGKIAKALQAYTDTIFRVLGSEDQPFYYAAKIRSLYEQSKVEAINKGLKGKAAQEFIDNLMKNPSEQMVKYASTDAETAVFQNQTALGKVARQIQNTKIGEFIIPFGRTPSAVATQILNYSPIGIAKTIIQNIGRGRFDQRLFSQGMGRGLTGTGVLAIGAELYKKGLITTSRPKDEREQKLWELEGKQPNSIKINGKWRQIQVLGPIGNMLAVGASFKKAFDNSGSTSEAMATGLADSLQSFTQQTFLTGVSNFISAVSDPARSAQNVVATTLASAVPTFMGDVARATDIKERRAIDIFDNLQAKIPGLRNSLEPQVDVLGNEKNRSLNSIEVMLDPTRPSKIISSHVISELRRLTNSGVKVSPTLLGDKKGYSSLTDKQNTELWKKSGEILNSKLNNLFKLPEYQQLTDEKKGKIIDNFVSRSRINSRAGMVLEVTQGMHGEQLKSKLKELKSSGLLTNEVFNKYMELR